MAISPIDAAQPLKSIVSIKEIGSSNTQSSIKETSGDPSASFGNAIKKAVGELNSLQNEADKQAVNLASGDVEDVHKAMIAMNKAKLALDFAITVRGKVIDAYQEIMRMQV